MQHAWPHVPPTMRDQWGETHVSCTIVPSARAARARNIPQISRGHTGSTTFGVIRAFLPADKGVHMKKHERRSPFYAGWALGIGLGCAVFAPLGCGGDDSAPGPTTGTAGTGGTGGGGTGGAGGTAGTGGEAGTAGTGGGTADASGAACGGFASLRCPDPDVTFCDYDDGSAVCGQGDIQGICTPRPSNCTEDCPGVCGCDSKPYCNACKAHQAGVDDHPAATCDDAGT
jgi:hypothetical protein